MSSTEPNLELWHPTRQQMEASRLSEFATRFGLPKEYPSLFQWSIRNREEFWHHVWRYCEVIGDPGETVLSETQPFLDSQWFPNGHLNFAENLLKYNDSRNALVEINESGNRNELTYQELRSHVGKFVAKLKQLDIRQGDRVAAWLPNCIDTVVAMLAATSVGASWSSCSPDFGVPGALDRFSQIQPKLLLATEEYQYNGRTFQVLDNVKQIKDSLPSVKELLLSTKDPETCDFQRIYAEPEQSFEFDHFPFSHPVYIMFSSGTTGQPKCIVHGAGGTLLQHLKEHQLHTDLSREDVLFFFTTTGWMMWNWLVTGLATGCTLVLYDGSPFYPSRDRLISLIDQERITAFGVGARYISSIEKLRIKPKQSHQLDSLRCILSTGSPLSPESFDYIYRDLKEDVWLASISGGTDIISCFVLGNPWSPVYQGEIQGSGLGMDTQVYDEDGHSIHNIKGELVCTQSFPSAPIGFWGDEGDEKYHSAYFDRFRHIWAHGDFAEYRRSTGGYVIHGRSDAVLNPGGVRIGTAEIYRQLEHFEEISDALCVSQDWEDDTRVVLFVVLADDQKISRDLRVAIRERIRTDASPRHVPARILQVSDIPKTRSGKIAELAVRDVIHGRTVKNTSALENPECLAQFQNIPALER